MTGFCKYPILFLFLCVSSCAASQADERDFIEKEIRRTMRKQKLPAMAVTLVQGQEIRYQEAHGQINLEQQIPASTQSVFKLWSMAKAFTALEIFREVEEGLVDLDAPLAAYLPDFSIQHIFGSIDTMTIRDVLAHRAGLPRHEGLLPEGMERSDPGHLERFECGAANCYSAYPVGTRYKYSNLGYDLLGRIIEECRKKGFFEQMKLHVLNELDMQHADFYSGAIDSSLHRALGYEYHKGSYYPYVQYDINNFPSGNLYATIEDLSAFLKTMFRRDFFENEATLSLMLADHYSDPDDPETMGLGWKLAPLGNGDTLVWHDGGPTEGVGSLVAFLPEEKLGIAVVGNGTRFSGFYSLQFALKILNQLMREGNNDEQEAQGGRAVCKLSPEQMHELEGSYAAFGTLAKVKRKGKKLKVDLGGFSLRLLPTGSGEFAVTHWMEQLGLTKIFKAPLDLKQLRIDFRKDPIDGRANMIIHMMDVSHEICPKYPDYGEIPEEWAHLCGSYRRADRIAGGTWGDLSEGFRDIQFDEGVLSMSGAYGPILPLNDTILRVMSGPYHGEYLDIVPGSGVILHQKWAFVPEK